MLIELRKENASILFATAKMVLWYAGWVEKKKKKSIH